MMDTSLPLTQVMLAVSLDDGRRVMRALRVGVQITCLKRSTPEGLRYVLLGRFGERTVQTAAHATLGTVIVQDLLRQLVPATFPFVP